jgi:excisionase family DNA binding protein
MSDIDEMNRRLSAQYRHPERATLTVEQLAKVLGVSSTMIYEMVRTNEVPVPPIRLKNQLITR